MANCGYRTGLIKDPTRSNWQNNAERPILWSAWYPTEDTPDKQSLPEHFFDLGNVIENAEPTKQNKLPVVMLSHGTGGTAESLGWLARSLVHKGYVVLGASHHGNTGLEPYLAEGFLCWWERATDLSVLLSSMIEAGFLAGRLDMGRVSAVGFSLGAYTVLALAGARTSLAEFEAWRKANKITEGGPKEFPNAADSIQTLLKSSEAFRASWARHQDDVTDPRIKSVVAIAPPSPVRSFTQQSISALQLPVTILTGGDDREAPSSHCVEWLVAQNTAFQHFDLGQYVGHYTFLEFPADRSLMGREEIFSDHDKVDRTKVHEQAATFVDHALNTSI